MNPRPANKQCPLEANARSGVTNVWAISTNVGVKATKVAQRVGIEHAKQNDACAYLGRKPSFTRTQFRSVRDRLGQNTPLAQIAKNAGLSRQTVYRIKNDPAACEAALADWGL
jgi:DNA invertase Pin-like site-specific DNA recombinase